MEKGGGIDLKHEEPNIGIIRLAVLVLICLQTTG
jgi:hypothetical protein